MDARAPIGRANRWAWALAASLLFGCASLSTKVRQHATSGEFEKARRLLDGVDAGEAPDENLAPDVRAAREFFTTQVEEHFLGGADELFRKDALDAACDRIRAGAQLASWSRRLRERLEDCDRRTSKLDELSARWKRPPAAADEGRKLFEEIRIAGNDYRARPSLVVAVEAARNHILDEWTRLWKDGRPFVTAASVQTFRQDLDALGVSELENDVCVGAAVDLSLAINDPLAPFRLESNALVVARAASCLRTRPERETATPGRAIEDASRAWLDHWFRDVLPDAAKHEPAVFAGIGAYERFLADHPWVVTERLRCAVADMHLRAAETRAGAGTAAALSLLHVARTTELCSDLASDRVDAVRQKAVSSIIAGEELGVEIGIDADPSVDPQIYDLVRVAIITYLRSKSTYGFAWRFLPPGQRSRTANVVIEAADLRIPDFDALPRISSSYYSHSDTIPNPQKGYLRDQIESQRLQVDFAESALRTAVSSFNIYPTEYGLLNVNRAKAEYSRQVDYYNALVRQYNATPDTVTEPVYLPYLFAEGQVEFGWDVTISWEFGPKKGRGHARSMDSGFVRIGTRYNDRDPSRRRDHPLDFEVTPDRMIGHLVDVVDEIAGEMGPDLGELVQFKFSAGLSDEEIRVARWVFHPLDNTSDLAESMGVTPWAVAAAARIELPKPEFRPPVTLLDSPPERPVLPMTPATAARWFEGLVGEVIAQGPNRTSVSSGAIVSGDGLILTCAHGLDGRLLSVRFSAGAWAGTYPAEIVFVNERTDTALLRAKGLRTRRWMEVRLDAPAEKGEQVVAIGNPSLPGGTQSVEAISMGIVSNPESSFYGIPRMVADVAIASGSSGGPVVALRDGKIVGVVVAVARPELSAGRASSKAVSLAAPAYRIGEWLGLKNGKALHSSSR